MEIQESIELALKEFSPTRLKVINESHLHAGNRLESHFRVEIESDDFKEVDLLSRHKMVYEALKEIMPKVHALSLYPSVKEESTPLPPSPKCPKNQT